jgi:hypothetical protein
MWGNEHLSQVDNGWQMPFIQPRPSKIGGNSILSVTAEASVSGSDSRPIPAVPPPPYYTDTFGTPVDIKGPTLPDLNKRVITVRIVPTAWTNTAGNSSTVSYYHFPGGTWGLVLYKDANKVQYTLGATPLYYRTFGFVSASTDCPLYGGLQGASRMSLSDAVNTPSGAVGYVPVQPWLTPPDTVCIPNKVGLWCRAQYASISLTARITMWWATLA